MAAKLPSETQIARAVERLVTDALPPGWSLRTIREPRTRRADFEWTIRAPDGSTTSFVVEVKKSLLGRQVDQALAQLSASEGTPAIAAPYLGPSLRTSLASRGINYVDSTGNLRLVADRPGLFIERQGAAKDPWPSQDSLQSLRGRGAGRAVRALVDHSPPYGVRDLANRSGVPLGSLSRTLDLLDREGLVRRDDRGSVDELDWEGAIRRWSQDYDFAHSNQVGFFLDPRGLSSVASKLSQARWTYAATGALAAERFAPIAPARQAAAYVNDIDGAADRLKLRPTDAGANVVLAEPYDRVVFDRTSVRDDLCVVAAAQLAADLLTGPGREPSEGVELLAWMRTNEKEWRG